MPAPEWPDELGGLRLELRDHLKRLAIWSGISVLVGIKLIVGASWNGKPPASRAQFREFIWLNQGLNAGYVGVGLALALAGSSAAVVGSGWAVVPQGLALLVMDGILLRRVPR